MSNKAECPVCNAYTSSVLTALEQGDPCPYCGASAGLIGEVQRARKQHADEALVERLREMGKQLVEARVEVWRLRDFVSAVRMALDELPSSDIDQPEE